MYQELVREYDSSANSMIKKALKIRQGKFDF